MVNVFAFRYTKLISVAFGTLTTWPIARLSFPTTFSPITTFVFNPNPDTNLSLSKTGVAVVFDSRTAITLTTSGTFRDISLSSTLTP